MASSTNHLEQREMLLDAWVEKRRAIAALEAEASALLADRLHVLDDDVRELPQHREAIHRSMIAEYSAAGRVSKGSIEYAFADARLLEAEHPAVRDSFHRGSISAAHVREIIREGMVVRLAVREGRAAPDTVSLYDAAALVVAEHDSPARTRAMVRQIASSLASETVVERHRRARGERSVTVRSLDDGLALLQVVLPEHLAHAILDRLTRLAQQVIATRSDRSLPVDHEPMLSSDDLDSGDDPVFLQDLTADAVFRDDPLLDDHHLGDPRYDDPRFGGVSFGEAPLDPHVIFGESGTYTTDPSRDAGHVAVDDRGIDEVRTDLLSDLLLASDPSAANGTGLEGIQARIQVTIAAETLLGADGRPAELDGVGPLHPDVARDLAGRNGGWSRLFLDDLGMVTATAAYAPTAAMRRHLQARDQHCRFPGCRTPVHRCQIDHNHDHARGGRTSIDNLSHFCRGHHALKHPDIADQHRWRARQLAGGDIEWTSPLGRVYSDASPRRVMFV
ncbi:HNH endonuclease signature motif containing protein [Microbacterium sp. MYb62]|uniref:HNH endonuclease signature motif containing protein n=1 Tax=Microbacterium sp. MYb62 TaxID=1848690 RepID=UPI000CFD1A97|nr:HNH endonuclease signature motif containing protein [Microbacterium sp. MYb62]PRB12087.1 HNH endonuclease [Microbacterium sp. MYb62]